MSKDKQKLWIVTESFYPEELSTPYILTKIASALSSKYDVRVICGPCNSVKGRVNTNVELLLPNIVIKRVKSLNLNVDNIVLRIIKFVVLSIQLFTYVLLCIKRQDKVFIVTNPAPLLVLISFYKRIKGFDLTVLIHDIFPENTIPAGIISAEKSWKYKLLKILFDRAYSYSDKLIVLGRDMKSIVLSKLVNEYSPQVEIIENWGDICNINFKPIRTDCVNIQYAGNIGRVQGLCEFIDVLRSISNECLKFEFVGDGAVKNELKEKVRCYGLANISFFDSYKREQQQDILSRCTFSLVTLATGMYGLGVPSKSYNILAAGRPILFIGDTRSEIALMIKENNIGFCFESTDVNALRVFLDSIKINDIGLFCDMGKRARKLAEEKFSEDKILEKFLEVI